MNSCPNRISPEWKALSEAVGEFEAMRDFMEYGDIRTPKEVQQKISKSKTENSKPIPFNKQLDDLLLDFVKGLKINVVEQPEEIVTTLRSLTGSPLAAFDVLQKYLAIKEDRNLETVPEVVAYIAYTFLGQKSKLGKDLWYNISSWDKYDYYYNKFAPFKRLGEPSFTMDDEVIESEDLFKNRNNWAHRQVIVEFIKQGLVGNFQKDISPEVTFDNPDLDSKFFAKKGFKNPYVEGKLLSIWNKLYNWIREHILGVKKFDTYNQEKLNNLLLDIVDNVYKKDYSKFIRGVYEKDGKLFKADGTELELKDYDKTLEKDQFAKSLILRLVENPYVNFKLSGSQVVRKYGNLWRDVNEDLHDIDGVITLETFRAEQNAKKFYEWITTRGLALKNAEKRKQFTKEIIPFLEEQAWYRNVQDMFPSWTLGATFIGKDHKKGESVTISGYIEHPTETVLVKNADGTGASMFFKPSDNGKILPKRYVLDFFLRTAEGNYPEIFDNYWKDWKQIFEAKIAMGRSKDINDLIYFDPFINDKYKFTSKGYRYFSFSETQSKIESSDINSEEANVAFFKELGNYNNKYTALTEPLLVNEETNKKDRGNEIANKLAALLANNIEGLSVEMVTEEQAAQIIQDAGIPYNNEAAFYVGDKVYFIADRMTTEIVFHEFAHPIVRSIALSNNTLFNNLYNQVASTPEGRELINAVKRSYPELKEGSDRFKEEVIVFAISKAANLKYNNKAESTGFVKFIKDLLFAVKQMFRRLLKGQKISIEKLDVDTTLDQLAEMLNSEKFKINTEVLNQEDVIAFARDIKQQVMDDLLTLDQSDMNKITREFSKTFLRQRKIMKADKYTEVKELFEDKLKKSDLSEVLSNLREYNISGEVSFKTDEEEIEYLTNHALALYNSLEKLNNMGKKAVGQLRKIATEEIDDKQALLRASNLNKFIVDWLSFLDYIQQVADREVYRDNLTPDNALFSLISEARNNLQRGKRYTDDIYSEGVADLINTQLKPLNDNIEAYYERIRTKLKAKNAPQSLIDRYEEEYNEVRLTPETVKKLIEGELGDAHALNSFLEGYMYNQDPVVFGFASYVKDRYSEMYAEIQSSFNNFIDSIDGLASAAGYKTAYQRMTMGKDLWFLDAVSTNKEDSKPKLVWKFLTPFRNYQKDYRDLKDRLSAAHDKVNENNSNDNNKELINAITDLAAFEKKYMNRRYTDEYYELYNMFNDEIGRTAFLKREKVIGELRAYNGEITDPEEILNNTTLSREKLKELKQLSSFTYSDGTPKPIESEDYAVAKRLQEYNKLSKKFHEWKPREGAFESAYLHFEDLTATKYGRGSEEYDATMEEWIEKNTVRKTSQRYFDDRNRIFTQLSALSSNDAVLEEINELREELNSYIAPYKDQNYIPIGSDIPPAVVKRIKEIEEELKELRKSSSTAPKGMTKAEYGVYKLYNETLDAYKIGAGAAPSADLTLQYEVIIERLAQSKLSQEDIDKSLEISQLYYELDLITKKSVSQNYLDTLNSFIQSTPKMLDYIQKNLNISEFSESDVNDLLLREPDMINMAVLFKMNPDFADWILKNHSTYTNQAGLNTYSPLSIWTYSRPASSDYYEQTIIFDNEGNEIKRIDGVPTAEYTYRTVKDFYVDDAGNEVKLKTERKTILDCFNEGLSIENATVDMLGNFLPKINNTDRTYINEDYFNLEKNDPAKFKLLNKLIQEHLNFQTKLPYDSRLDLEAPRYGQEDYEIFTTTRQNPLSVWAGKVKRFFSTAADDLEEGLNPTYMNASNTTDLLNDAYAKVPITGKYDLPSEQVSMDVLRGMTRYMQSGIKQKTLIDMLPTAQALRSILQDPGRNEEALKRKLKGFTAVVNLSTGYLYPKNSQQMSIRAKAINAFIEREFEGKTQTGFTKNMGGLNKFVNGIFGLSSTSFFAFNLPSTLKNTFGFKHQAMIQAAGGKYFTVGDYLKGSMWANATSFEISMQLYKTTSRSLNVQLVEMMDPLQGRLMKKITQGVGTTRSLFKDTATLGFSTNVRQWTELNDSLSIFGAMLTKTLVEQTMPDGTVNKIKYSDAWEVVDGKVQLKEGVDAEWAPTGAKYKNFIKTVHGLINNIAGAYSQFESPEAGRYLLFRVIANMKTYFTRMFMDRWQYRYRNGKFLPRYDANLNDVSKGFYIDFLQTMVMMFKTRGKSLAYMTPDQIVSLKKVSMDTIMLVVLQEILVKLFFGFDPDDEDRFEKLRKKSGPLPTPFTSDSEDPFHMDGWISNHLLNLAMQTRAENEAWIPWPGMGLDDYLGLIKMESISVKSTMDYYQNIFTYLIDYATDDPSGRYKRDVGPYNWQQEESSKIVNQLMKVMSISGTTVEPIILVRNLQKRDK